MFDERWARIAKEIRLKMLIMFVLLCLPLYCQRECFISLFTFDLSWDYCSRNFTRSHHSLKSPRENVEWLAVHEIWSLGWNNWTMIYRKREKHEQRENVESIFLMMVFAANWIRFELIRGKFCSKGLLSTSRIACIFIHVLEDFIQNFNFSKNIKSWSRKIVCKLCGGEWWNISQWKSFLLFLSLFSTHDVKWTSTQQCMKL